MSQDSNLIMKTLLQVQTFEKFQIILFVFSFLACPFSVSESHGLTTSIGAELAKATNTKFWNIFDYLKLFIVFSFIRFIARTYRGGTRDKIFGGCFLIIFWYFQVESRKEKTKRK